MKIYFSERGTGLFISSAHVFTARDVALKGMKNDAVWIVLCLFLKLVNVREGNEHY